MSQTPPPIPSGDKENSGNILAWALCSVVGMLAVAALVFVLMHENNTDKAERLVREAKVYMQEDNLLAAKVLLEEAVVLNSKDAKSLLDKVSTKLREQRVAQEAERKREQQRAQEIKRKQEVAQEKKEQAEKKNDPLAPKPENIPRKKRTLPDAIAFVKPSIVAVNSVGSGFVVAKDMICTNAHVIEGASEVSIKFNDGTERDASGIRFLDEESDIAILTIPKIPNSAKPLFALNAFPVEGETVVAMGHPIGAANTQTAGIVSSIRSADEMQKILGWKDSLSGAWIQTDAAINPGNSGGPLIDLTGAVVGMNTLRKTDSNKRKVLGIGFAISSYDIRQALALAKKSPLADFDSIKKQPDRSGNFFDPNYARPIITRAADEIKGSISVDDFIKHNLGVGKQDDAVLHKCFKLHLNIWDMKKLKVGTVVHIKGPGFTKGSAFYGEVATISGTRCLLVEEQPGAALTRDVEPRTKQIDGVFLVHEITELKTKKGDSEFVFPLVNISHLPPEAWRKPLTAFYESILQMNQSSYQKTDYTNTSIKTVDGLEHPFKKHLGEIQDLSDADLSDANLSKANFREKVLERATLKEANLSESSLHKANLKGANLSGALLRSANLVFASLNGANLTGANLTGANMRVAKLTNADLSNATLTGADLQYATLTNANLTGANLSGSDFKNVYFYNDATWTDAFYYTDNEPTWVSGMDQKWRDLVGIVERSSPVAELVETKVEYYENGQEKSEQHFKNGIPDGLWTLWHENGNQKAAVHFKNGETHGLLTQWYPDGQKEYEGHYKNGKLDGLETEWDKDGNKALEIQWKDGRQISRKEF